MHVIVVGGSIAGLATALALSRDGHRTTVLEQDTAPLPESAEAAFSSWRRRGSPQIWHSHAFLGRMYRLIRDREPELLQKLLDLGADPLSFEAQASQYFEDPVFEPEDKDITLLACRRVTFEWALRQHMLDSGRIEFRDGVEVGGLESASQSGSIPHVTGVSVRERGGAPQTLRADLVVDASGRRSKLGSWLEAIGAGPLREESEPCGIYYSSRFYRLSGEGRPTEDGIIGGDLGYVKFGIFPADGGTFSVTLAAAPDDEPLRRVLRADGFDAVARHVPMVWDWTKPGVAEPLTEAQAMSNLQNTRRFLVEDGVPKATGVVAIGDALIHSNPITGRGCSLAWVGAYALAEELQKHPDDPHALSLALDAAVEREMVPWLEAQKRQDRMSIAVNTAQREGRDPLATSGDEDDPGARMRAVARQGLMALVREDIVLMRAFMRVGHLLDAPNDMLARPELLQRAMKAAQDTQVRPPAQGPSRAEMLEILEQI